jgi:hypothetical protein
MSSDERAKYRKRRVETRAEREKTAKMMDLQYFLEMVDQKHRYGSNLRAYHEHWKKEDTHENFFYWLDYGDGRKFEHPTVSRERLEKEQVRYLSREERLNYLVNVDDEGRLCWAKNGNRINTTMEFKDSVNGIVPVDDNSPAFGPNGQVLHDGQSKNLRRGSTSSVSSDSGSEHSDVEGEHYVNEDLNKAKGVSKIKYVSAATILNHLLRSSVKPNSWIFVSVPHLTASWRIRTKVSRLENEPWLALIPYQMDLLIYSNPCDFRSYAPGSSTLIVYYLHCSRLQIPHSACISVSNSLVLSSTAPSYMALESRLQA